MFAKQWFKVVVAFIFLVFFIGILETEAFARVGGGKSFMGSRGSRSYSAPAKPYPAQRQEQRNQQNMAPAPASNPTQAPSMWKSLAMGVAGGFLGSMLFSAFGQGMGGMAGGLSGIIGILLIGGLLYGVYRLFKARRQTQAQSNPYYDVGQRTFTTAPQPEEYAKDELETGIANIKQRDFSFEENKFKDLCLDNFFKIQGGWANRDMTSIKHILTDTMFSVLQGDANTLKAEKKINKLENIAVRTVEIVEVWEEQGFNFITVKFLASILDYTISETGELLSGSKTEPIKFEEFWTFTRKSGDNTWQLSAINQM